MQGSTSKHWDRLRYPMNLSAGEEVIGNGQIILPLLLLLHLFYCEHWIAHAESLYVIN